MFAFIKDLHKTFMITSRTTGFVLLFKLANRFFWMSIVCLKCPFAWQYWHSNNLFFHLMHHKPTTTHALWSISGRLLPFLNTWPKHITERTIEYSTNYMQTLKENFPSQLVKDRMFSPVSIREYFYCWPIMGGSTAMI